MSSIILVLMLGGNYVTILTPYDFEACKRSANAWVSQPNAQAVCVDMENKITLKYYSKLIK